jgi:hypothetical protein
MSPAFAPSVGQTALPLPSVTGGAPLLMSWIEPYSTTSFPGAVTKTPQRQPVAAVETRNFCEVATTPASR